LKLLVDDDDVELELVDDDDDDDDEDEELVHSLRILLILNDKTSR